MVLTLNNRTTMENKDDYIYNSQLEGMNVFDLSDLVARASSILRKKLLDESESLYREEDSEESCGTITDETSIIQNEESESDVLTENNDNEEVTASVEEHEKSDEKMSSETTEDNKEESDEYSDVKILPCLIYNEKLEPTEEFEGKFLGLMDVSGRPTKEFSQVGATVGGKKAERLKKLSEEEGLEAAIEKMRDHDSQWERVYSPNGICPTIAKSVPPLILVSNEVDTCNEPMEIEIEIPKRTLNPLW